MLISKQMATSTKENQAVIVQEDEYLRDKMEEYKLFLERHPDYYDDDLIVDENKSYSEPDEIAQPKRRRTNSKNETSSSHAIQGNRFSQRLQNNHNLEEKRTSDQNSGNETECKYCKRAFGYSRLFPNDVLLRHYRSSKCGSKLINVEDIDEEEEGLLDNLIPPPESLGTCTGFGASCNNLS